MENKKSYFLDSETCDLYELSESKTKKLKERHPNWLDYDCEKNTIQLLEVQYFFKEHGKLLACKKTLNIFVGLTV